MSKQTFQIENAAQWKLKCVEFVDYGLNALRGGAFRVTFDRPKRTNPQNALMFKLLTQISEQVDWYGKKYSKEAWKDILSCSLSKQELAPGIDGGLVGLGLRTSQQNKEWLSNMIELCYAFGAQQGVKFTTNEYER